MVDRLRGKVALITGAASGQGEAEARRFVAEGARVAVADIADERGRAVASELGDAGRFVPLDVTDPEQWDRAVASVVGIWGRIDVLVNNAGIGLPPVPFVDAPLADHYRVIDVNLHGVYLGMRAVVPAMTAGGSIVNISSIDGMVGIAGMTSYVASKFAVRGMTRSAALELGARGIRVNSIHPGVIETDMGAQTFASRARQTGSNDVEAARGVAMKQHPIGRLGVAEDIALGIVFLASDDAGFMTGSGMVIDGGLTAQ